jgi:hypothetical protein
MRRAVATASIATLTVTVMAALTLPGTAVATGTQRLGAGSLVGAAGDHAGLTSSKLLTTAPVMTGRVLSPGGAPAAGSDVTLYAWPSNDVTEAQQVGDTVNLQPVAYTTTSSTGTFALRLTDAAQLLPYVGRDAIANLTAVASTSTGQVTESDFSREVVASGSTTSTDPATGTVRTPAVTLASPSSDTAGEPVPARVESVTMRLGGGSSTASDGVGSRGVADLPMEKTCITTLQKKYTPVWVLVGQNYSTNAYARANFQYYSNAHSTMGVGVSATGRYGSFQASGTSTKTSSSGIDFPTTYGARSRYHRTKYQFAKYMTACSSPKTGQIVRYSVRAYKFVSGASEVAVAAVSARYCAPFLAHSGYNADRTRSITWTNGADMSAGIGIDLSAQTGYGSAARIQWRFPHRAYLCGTADYPGEGAFRMLRAKAR